MLLHHVIPASRLRKQYFRRWFYWRGISRALLYERAGLDMESPEQTHARLFERCPTCWVCPVTCFEPPPPTWLRGSVTWRLRRFARAFEHELWLCFFAGILRQRARDSRSRRPSLASRHGCRGDCARRSPDWRTGSRRDRSDLHLQPRGRHRHDPGQPRGNRDPLSRGRSSSSTTTPAIEPPMSWSDEPALSRCRCTISSSRVRASRTR